MSYGFYALNESGETQVDGEYPNFCFSESGTVTNIDYDSKGRFYFDITNPAIIAFKPQTDYFSCVTCPNSATQGMAYSDADSGLSIPFKVYRQTLNSDVSSGDYGFAAYNSSGNVVFNSNKSFMEIVGFTTFTDPDSEENYDITVNDADNNYFILAPIAWGHTIISNIVAIEIFNGSMLKNKFHNN